MQKLAGNPELRADLANLVLIERCQRLDDAAAFDQLLDACDPIVVGLDHVRSRGAAGFDSVGIDGPLPEDPVAIEKMAGTQDALLDGDKLLADDVPLLLRIADARQSAQNLGSGIFDVKRCGAEGLKQALDVGGLAVPHQPSVDVNPIDALRTERPQAQRGGDRRIDSAADEEENIAVCGDAADLLLESADAVLGVPIALAAADAEQKVREDLAALTRMGDFGMKLHRDNRALAMGHGRDVDGLTGSQHFEAVGDGLDQVAMVHPDLRIAVEALEQRVRPQIW